MDQSEIELAVLGTLYEAFFRNEVSANLNVVRESLNVDEPAFWRIVEGMTGRGLIRGWTMGGNYKITSIGAIYAEQNAIASIETTKLNNDMRGTILDTLVKVFDENRWFSDAHVNSLSKETGLDVYDILNNLTVLEDLGYVTPIAVGSYRPTTRGNEAVQKLRQHNQLRMQFDQISNIPPQQRGRAFEKFFAELIEQNGWQQEESTRTAHEEIDVIIHKHTDYYLVECKWEKEPVEARIIRELFGKLENRFGVKGLVVSMSGFTSGAILQAAEYASKRVLLFFGSQDVQAIMDPKVGFDKLLEDKYQQLITRKTIVYG